MQWNKVDENIRNTGRKVMIEHGFQAAFANVRRNKDGYPSFNWDKEDTCERKLRLPALQRI